MSTNYKKFTLLAPVWSQSRLHYYYESVGNEIGGPYEKYTNSVAELHHASIDLPKCHLGPTDSTAVDSAFLTSRAPALNSSSPREIRGLIALSAHTRKSFLLHI